MSDQPATDPKILDTEAVDGEVVVAEPVRDLPAQGSKRDVEQWRGDVRTVALVAAGGAVAGVATVAAVRAVKGKAGRKLTGRRKQTPGRVVASRSFLVDVHLLGR